MTALSTLTHRRPPARSALHLAARCFVVLGRIEAVWIVWLALS